MNGSHLHITLISKPTLTWLLSQATALHRSRVSCVWHVRGLQGLPSFWSPAGPALPTPPGLPPPSPNPGLCFSCLQTQIHPISSSALSLGIYQTLHYFVLIYLGLSLFMGLVTCRPMESHKLQGMPLIKFACPH